jgi:outer membrane protein OmpA-like peptidoglycan-associated protein
MKAVLLLAAVIFLMGRTTFAGMSGMGIKASVTGDVYFGKGAYELTDEAKKTLAGVADWVKKHRGASVMLAGYDEQRTPRDESIELARRRTVAVADYLSSLGVAEDSISAISFGNTKLAAEGEGDVVWSKNRRVRYLVVEPPPEGKMEGPPSGVCQRCKK